MTQYPFHHHSNDKDNNYAYCKDAKRTLEELKKKKSFLYRLMRMLGLRK